MTITNKYPLWKTETRARAQAVYDQMRVEDPVYRAIGPVSGNPFWVVTRYDDAVAVLRDNRFIKDARNLPGDTGTSYMADSGAESMFDAVNRHMLNLDPPDHTRLRGLVHKAFTPARVRDLEPRIQAITDGLLDAIAARESDTGDLLDDFAYPLPITVIAEMLGIPADDREQFRTWTEVLLFSTDMEENQIQIMAFVNYMNGMIEERRATDTGDILSALVRAEEDGDRLDHMELLSMIFLLLVAGHETTVNLIGNGALLLIQHPDQRDKLLADMDLLPTAIEEMLRYNGPVETPTLRFAAEDVEVGGVVIPQGEAVLPSLLGANRDPAVFDNPNTFDITRQPNKHIAFGHGIHYCVGAPLARMEATIAFRSLLQRYPRFELAVEQEELQWKPSLLIHGLEALPVRYRA